MAKKHKPVTRVTGTTRAKKNSRANSARARTRTVPSHSSPVPSLPRQPIVVGIGASAGGLDAFKRFFRNMPEDSGLAFVLIQHLDPTHESLTAELVARGTPMSAVQVEVDTAVSPNHIYVIPPNRYLRMENGVLRVTTPAEPRGMRMPIDVFMRSLAADQQEKAIGVVLSGTGTDGTLGLKEIKAYGGMAMAQDPTTAEYDGMPRSAIAGGVDYVLAPEKMAPALLQYLRHSYVKGNLLPLPPEDKRADDLNGIIALLRARVKFDFTPYRKGTIVRRIQRRMSLTHVENMSEYLRVLRDQPAEVSALFKDLLISVTSFFREPKAWQALEQDVLRKLIAEKSADSTVRVWVAGCATGEEAYSIAMLLIEQLQAAQKRCTLQIFATDVDAEALEFARAGVYPESIAADVSPARLHRFFSQSDHSYRISKELREAVIFAEQNLITNPPFSRLDLICCRNLLIYLEQGVQKKLLSLLHFSLAETGYLFLGSAESIGSQEDLFETVSKRWRIYRRIGPTRHDKVEFPVVAVPEDDRRLEPPRLYPVLDLNRLASVTQRLLLDRYAPASVIVNRKFEILHFAGRTDDYLTQPPGLPTHDLISRAREGLQTPLRGSVHKALRTNEPVTIEARVKRNGVIRRIKVTAEALKGPKELEGLVLVSFVDEPEKGQAIAVPRPPTSEPADESLVRQLEFDLKTTREDLQTTIEELETSNEELKAANEEVMSINEELQSTNEELETSKEELQSLNEELRTVNNQLEAKVSELETSNDDLENLLGSTNVPTLFLDTHFQLRRFTPAATRLFKLIPSDVGRPIDDVTRRFTDPELTDHAAAVLEKLVPLQREIHAEDGRWYIRQVLPYRTRDNRIAGVVVTFSDVAAEILQEARVYAESIVDTVRDPLLVLHDDLRIRSANRSFYETFETTPEKTVDQPLYQLLGGRYDVPRLRAALPALPGLLAENKALQPFDVEWDLPRVGRRAIQISGRAVTRPDGSRDCILLTMADITERVQSEKALRATNEALRGDALFEGAPAGIVLVDARGRIVSANAQIEKLFGYRGEELIGRSVETLVPAASREAHAGFRDAYVRNPETRPMGVARELMGVRKDGTEFPVEIGLGPVRTEEGLVVAAHVSDITARKEAEAGLHKAHEELERRVAERTTELRAANEHLGELTRRMLAVQDEERRRIGQDLHDSTAQNLAAVTMNLAMVQQSLKRPNQTTRQALADCIGLIEQATREIRTVSYLLHPPLLDEVGLASAINWYADGFSKRSGIAVEVDLSPDLGRLPAEAEVALFRIVQECLSNIHRHADGSQAHIRIVRDDDRVALTVKDNGRGIKADALKAVGDNTAHVGVGVTGMRERMRQLGGTLEISSSDGGGTVVEAVLPLTPRNAGSSGSNHPVR